MLNRTLLLEIVVIWIIPRELSLATVPREHRVFGRLGNDFTPTLAKTELKRKRLSQLVSIFLPPQAVSRRSSN
jgi:hypothetical protein